MNHRKRLSSRQTSDEQQHTEARQHTESAAREFGSVEELLRHDALHTPVPPAIAVRLQDSLAKNPPPRPWWRRWFGSPQ
jgi:hypothetical protein